MKFKILGCLIAVAGALLISATNGYSFGGIGDEVNAVCAPVTPYTGDCTLCHLADRAAPTPAKDAAFAGGTTLTDFFCPDTTPPPPPPGRQITWVACTPEQIGPHEDRVRLRVVNCNENPAGNKNGWMTLRPANDDKMLDVILAAMDANREIAIAFDGTTDPEGYNFVISVIYKKSVLSG